MRSHSRTDLTCLRALRTKWVLSLAASGLLLSVAKGQDATWGASGGGVFNSGANWVGGSVPTGLANISNAPTGTITFNSGTTTLTSVRLANDYGVTANPLTFDLTNAYLDLTATAAGFAVGAAVTNENDVRILGGTARIRDINIGYYNNALSNSLTIGGGAKITGLVVSGLSTSILRVGNGSSSSNTAIVTGPGTELIATQTGSTGNFYVGASGTTASNPTSGVGNLLSVRDGAVVKMKTNIYIGHTGSFGADAPNVIEADGGAFRVTDGVSRDIFLRDGLIRVKNSGWFEASRLQANEANSSASIEFSSGSLWAGIINMDAPGTSPISIGDGGAAAADLKIVRTSTFASVLSFADGVQFKSNAIFSGSGTLNGTVTTTPGMKVRPDNPYSTSSVAGATSIGTLRVVNSDWINTGVDVELHAGNFPLTLAAAIAGGTTFSPPVDKFDVAGIFTLGGTVTVDLANYAPPQDQNYDIKLVGWSSSIGATSSMPVSFIHGSPLPYEFRADGLYLTAAMVTAGSSWNLNGSGSWSVAGNWLGGVPNAADATANFGTILTSAATVTLDGPQMVGKVNFSSPISYTLSGATLTLDVNTGTSALIDVTAGSHTIAAPLVLADNTAVSTAASTSLAITGGVSGNVTLTKSGDGVVTTGKVNIGTLSVNQGTLQIQSNGSATGVAEVLSVTTSGTGKLDITNNGVVINYNSPADPTAAVRAALVSGYAAGAWNGAGIMSSAAGGTSGFGVGYAKAGDLGISQAFGSITVDADTLIVRRTYNGDSNLDGKVNTLDFNLLAGGFGGGSASWMSGDYDYDGDVDSLDFNSLAGNYGKSLPPPAPSLGAVVPEPCGIAVLSLIALARSRRRSR